MNIAFPALVIFLLLLPGILFQFALRRGFWRSPVALKEFTEEVARGALAALVLHIIAIFFVTTFSSYRIDFQALVILMTGWPKLEVAQEQNVLRAVGNHSIAILSYLIGVGALGLILGFLLHYLVRKYCLDIRFPLLRFNNDWHYMFMGEALSFGARGRSSEIRSLRDSVDLVFVTAVVDQPGEAMLYWGILTDFAFNRSGGLDRIVLKGARRRKLLEDPPNAVPASGAADNADLSPADGFYEIRGDFFVIQFEAIKNLNIEYIALDVEVIEDDEGPGVPDPANDESPAL
jgi:hypothetical protein